MFRTSGIVLAMFFLLTSVGLGQDNRYDVSLGGAAVLSKTSTGNGTTLTPTNSCRRSDHRQVPVQRPQFGLKLTMLTPEFTDLSFRAADLSGARHYLRILGSIRFRFLQSPKIEPFVFAGAAAFTFYPT